MKLAHGGRRAFLCGTGGVMLGLPLLEALWPRRARAADPSAHTFAIFVRQANGVQMTQSHKNEPDRWWPKAHGPLTPDSVAGQATEELGDWLDKITLVSGVNLKFGGAGCAHTSGSNQFLTAAKPGGGGNESLALGESIDNRIAREYNPDEVEPLALYAGKKSSYIAECMSFRGPEQLRSAENNPWNVYKALFSGFELDERLKKQLYNRRISVNDLVRADLKELRTSLPLTAPDKVQLDTHLEAIRDIELELACTVPPPEEFEAVNESYDDGDMVHTVARLQASLAAQAFACGLNRTATLQIGAGTDGTRYRVNGETYFRFHWISHRVQSDGGDAPAIEGADLQHHQIDRIHLRTFRHLLERLDALAGHNGSLLDDTVAMFTSEIATGSHSHDNLPILLAGSCGGWLKTGVYVDAGGVWNNKLLNTLLSAVGQRAMDDLVTDFGDSELEPGVIPEIVAGQS